MRVIKTALSAFGMSGKVFHAPFLQLHPGFELVAAWERNRQLISETYPGAKSCSQFGELLADESIELLVINSPNYTHYDLAKKALLAGKHVLVEKPFCISTIECDELIALAEKVNKKLSVYQNRRWDSDFKTVKKVVESGMLGDIAEVEIHFDRYDENLSYKLHKETPGPGAGLLYDLGPHLIDQALQLLGMPDAVFADLAIMRRVSRVDDYLELLLFYPHARVRLKAGYLVREALPAYSIHGQLGSFIKPRADIQESMLKAGKSPGTADWGVEPLSAQGILHTVIDGVVKRELVPSLAGNYYDFYDGLYKSITEGAVLPVTAQAGRDVIHIIEKALESFQTKKMVAV